MLLPVRLSVVCLSVTSFVHPTQAIEIFGNVSTPFGTSAICDLSINILRRSSEGNHSVGGGGLNRRGLAKYSDFGRKMLRQSTVYATHRENLHATQPKVQH